MKAYYNEHDRFAAAWLRELIKAGLIADGVVDERDIQQIEATELREFTQCHFFAGIGVWSYALRAAGWSDDTPVWTGSCPCQSFSASGKREGFSDERHLWPAWFRLLRECRPDAVFGEQVASKDGLAWFDIVSSDLEGEGYAVGAADTCAAGFGAPHIRQRLYFVAHATDARRDHSREHGRRPPLLPSRPEQCRGPIVSANSDGKQTDAANARGFHSESDSDRPTVECSDSSVSGRQPIAAGIRSLNAGVQPRGEGLESCNVHNGTGSNHNAECAGLERHFGDVREWRGPGWLEPLTSRSVATSGATRGFWRDCDWWWGRDEKYRPIKPGLFPLAHGTTARVGRLRGYGNALNAEQAKGFVEAFLAANGGGD